MVFVTTRVKISKWAWYGENILWSQWAEWTSQKCTYSPFSSAPRRVREKKGAWTMLPIRLILFILHRRKAWGLCFLSASYCLSSISEDSHLTLISTINHNKMKMSISYQILKNRLCMIGNPPMLKRKIRGINMESLDTLWQIYDQVKLHVQCPIWLLKCLVWIMVTCCYNVSKIH